MSRDEQTQMVTTEQYIGELEAERTALRAESAQIGEWLHGVDEENARLIDERDALRAQVERMQRVVDASFWFAGYVPLQRGLKVQQKRLSDALAALDGGTP